MSGPREASPAPRRIRRSSKHWGEICIDASAHVPHKLDQDALAWADVAISTCSEEVCPITPGVRRINWVFDDPKNLSLEQVRAIRDEIDRHVRELLAQLDEQGRLG